jgi:hypothetical protein
VRAEAQRRGGAEARTSHRVMYNVRGEPWRRLPGWCSDAGAAGAWTTPGAPQAWTPAVRVLRDRDRYGERWTHWARTRVVAVFEKGPAPAAAAAPVKRVHLLEREIWADGPVDVDDAPWKEKTSSFTRDVLLVSSLVTPASRDARWPRQECYRCTACGSRSTSRCGCGALAVELGPTSAFFAAVAAEWRAAPGNEMWWVRYPVTHGASKRRRPWAEQLVAVALHPGRPRLWASTTAAADEMHELDEAPVGAPRPGAPAGAGWLRAALAHVSGGD